MFACVNARERTPLEIYFKHLGNKKIYCILRRAAYCLFYFSQNAVYP
jgi:hypothetical protein